MSVAYTVLYVLSPVFSSFLNNGFDLKVVETLAARLIFLKKLMDMFACLVLSHFSLHLLPDCLNFSLNYYSVIFASQPYLKRKRKKGSEFYYIHMYYKESKFY